MTRGPIATAEAADDESADHYLNLPGAHVVATDALLRCATISPM
ncbi:hypothetical protein AB0M34_00750 [Nocardia sp. NPDC050193]